MTYAGQVWNTLHKDDKRLPCPSHGDELVASTEFTGVMGRRTSPL